MMEYYWVLHNCSIELAQPLPYVQYVVIGLSVWRPRLLEVPIVDFLCAGDGIRPAFSMCIHSSMVALSIVNVLMAHESAHQNQVGPGLREPLIHTGKALDSPPGVCPWKTLLYTQSYTTMMVINKSIAFVTAWHDNHRCLFISSACPWTELGWWRVI